MSLDTAMISCRKRGTQLTGRRRRGLGQQGRLEGDVLVGDAVPLVPRDRLARVERAVLHAVALLHLANAGLEICGNVVIALNTAFIHILEDMDECATRVVFHKISCKSKRRYTVIGARMSYRKWRENK